MFGYLGIYGGGTIILWYVCGVLFRESALGNGTVESWRSHGFDELKSTMLLFAISFAIAGAPFLMMPSYISAPLRLLIAPLLLLVAWFNQSAYIGVAFEPFLTFKTQTGDWRVFYIYVLALALMTMLAGVLYHVPYCSLIAAIIIAAAAIAFASAAGWHIGRTIKMMEHSIETIDD